MKTKYVHPAMFVTLLVALAAICTGCAAPTTAAQTSTPDAAIPPVRASNDIVAEGKVVPQRGAALSLPASGIVAEVLVDEGQAVESGQLLLRLSNGQQVAAVAQAGAALERAEAHLAELEAGPRTQEIAAAQATVDAAQAQLARLSQGARAEEIAAGEAALAAAYADLKKVQEGTEPEQLISAQAELSNAQAALRQAQAAYDQIKGNPDAGAYPQALELEQATNNYNAAKARYEELAKGSSPAALAKANAGVQQAAADLEKLKAAAGSAEIAAAEAEVRRTQAELDLLKAGSRPEAILAARADVASAQADLDRANAALRDTELVAPFAGSVVSLDVKVGEQVTSSTPVVRLADLNTWQVETTNLAEINVARVQEGARVRLSFDALPDLELAGQVSRIRSFGETRTGGHRVHSDHPAGPARSSPALEHDGADQHQAGIAEERKGFPKKHTAPGGQAS